MKSVLMQENGLALHIAGSEYDFRYLTRGDEIADDFERVLVEMGISPQAVYSGHQVHGANVAYADGENGEEFVFGKVFPDTDGLITDKPGIALMVKYADCTPIVLFDPKKKVLAALHSGWRSTVQRISQKAIGRMVDEFGCNKEDIFVFLGPSIDQANYEVGPEVYEAFEGFDERDSFFLPRNGKYLLSMSDANRSLVIEAGIPQGNVEVCRLSTFTDPRLHSSRGEGKDYGLNGLFVMMK